MLEKSGSAWNVYSKNYFTLIGIFKMCLHRKFFPSSSFIFYHSFLFRLSPWQLHREFYKELWCIGNSYLAAKVITSIAEDKPKFYRGGPFITFPNSFPLSKIILKMFGNYFLLSAQNHPILVLEEEKTCSWTYDYTILTDELKEFNLIHSFQIKYYTHQGKTRDNSF